MKVVNTAGEEFGKFIRNVRESKGIMLRAMAKELGVSANYLSLVERGERLRPTEDKVRKIAAIIGHDTDELLALAGRIASDLVDTIREQPREMADFLRAAQGLSAEDLAHLAREAQNAKEMQGQYPSGARAASIERRKFGEVVRREREKKEIGLKKMAHQSGVSATYLSLMERGECPPPAEEKVRRIAAIIEHDADELLAMAGRVASDLIDIIRERPREMADFLRAARGLPTETLAGLEREAQKTRERPTKR